MPFVPPFFLPLFVTRLRSLTPGLVVLADVSPVSVFPINLYDTSRCCQATV